MVRVLLFHYFKSQRVFFDSYQPTTLASTKDYLFLATGEMKVFVYSLEQPNFPLLCQFPTMSKPVRLMCNEKAKCVVTIESSSKRRNSRAGSKAKVCKNARAYFNWFKANPDEAVRTYVAGHSRFQRQEAEVNCRAFLALEIPTQFNVNSVSCCPTSGNIAIASEKKVSVFRWNGNLSSDVSETSAASQDLEHFLDIEPSMVVKEVVLADSYLAFRSNLDVQILKFVFTSEGESASSSGSGKSTSSGVVLQTRSTTGRAFESLLQCTEQVTGEQEKDDDCVLWSFDDCSPVSSLPQQLPVKSDEEVMFPTIRKEQVFKDFLPDPKEVLGPVSEVPGHPVTVAFGGLYGIGFAVDGCMLKVKGVTMLYRRFRVEQLSNDGNDSATLHTLQLLPTYTQGIPHLKEKQRSPLVPRNVSDPTLCGMSCLISGPKEGYVYDVFSTCKLISYYKYSCDTISVSTCNGLLHAITRQGIETYTVRMYAAASDWIRKNAAVDIQLDEQLLEEQKVTGSLADHEENLIEVKNKKGKGDKDLDSENANDYSTSCHAETESIPDSGSAGSAQSEESLLTDALNHEERENTKPEPRNDSNTCAAEDVPHAACSTVRSNNDQSASMVVDSPEGNTLPSRPGISVDILSGNKDVDSSSSDVKLTVDNSGRTLVRFTSGSRSTPPALSNKARLPDIEEVHDQGDANAELTGSLLTRAFAISNPLSRSNIIGAKVSDSVYQAAVSRLSSDCGWTLPVFDLESLRQVGLNDSLWSANFLNLYFSVFSFSFKHRSLKPQHDQGESASPDWRVFVLQNMDATQLYKAVMPLASRCQKHNAQAYHHLVCEQHFFLRTLCLADSTAKEDKKRKKLKKLLCESAANLAELFARIPSAYKDSLDYFALSGLTLRDIVDRASKSGQAVGEGVIYYLDEKLLGSDESVNVSENTARKIFKLYSRGKPGRVAEIILMSSLSGFSSDTALVALEELKKTRKAEGALYSLSPLDNLVRAVLYLHQCELDYAQSALFSIPKKKLVEVLTAHYYLLHEDGTRFTPLAQLLRKHRPKVLLEVLLTLHDNKSLSVETLLTLLGASKPDASHNDVTIGFMEAVLNDKNRLDAFDVTVIPLCGIYLERIGNTRGKRQTSASHQHVPKGEGHFGARHPWLNELSPFQGSLPLPGVPGCPLYKPAPPQCSPQLSKSSSLFSGPSRRTAAKVPYLATQRSVDTLACLTECSCCCCNEDLMKLQALLCSKFVSSELCNIVLSKIEGQKVKERTSLLLLCLPHVNRHTEAIAVMLDEFPLITLPYAEHYFGQDIEKWSRLVQTLLDLCKEDTNSDDSEFKRETIVVVLKGTLNQLSRIVTPSEFLALLPSDGCLGFFLPYLQHCYSRCASDSVSERLVAGTRPLAT
ncbi:Hermansky-Pudlak syndrome 3 protein-like [Orbicella faveolata]|uniref:Hermansky-Pudlak syndrome 3 protein-like n=1 Tax=Orbicella faveolata TaxID=48498 RepID=UPI0009E52E1A|nr:Hermansky-Pudlak syndrome 3 protein-like [Orbicella faveolata]